MKDERKRRLALISVLATLALLLVLGGASVVALGPQAIITVCPPPGTGCAYTTIQAAIDNASAGDTIRIAAGTYTENLTINGKTLTLRGGYTISSTEWLTDTGETIVNGNGADRTFLIHGNDSVLENLTITGGDTPDNECWGSGVWITNGNVTIRSSKLIDNWGDCSGGGVEVNSDWGPAHLTLEDTIVTGNAVGDHGGGITVWRASADLVNILVTNNNATGGSSGLHIEDSDITMMNSTISGNQGPPAIGNYDNFGDLQTTVIQNSIIWGNPAGDLTCTAGVCSATFSDIGGGWAGTGNIDENPWFVNPGGGDFHLLGNSPAIDAGNPAGAPPTDLDGTPRDIDPDMGAYEYQRFDHDMAVVDVLPSGNVAVNVAFPIRATLYNVGNQAENNVPVTCDIQHGGGTVYQQTVNSGAIAPLTWQVLDFPAYTPTSQGTYVLACQSALPNDGNPANDAFSRTLNALAEIADVWTKDNPDDNGDVPSDLNGWYESPDLWVRNDDDGGLIHQDPIVGVTNTVYVRLRNRGTVAISGTVDVYWIEPSLGVRCGDWAYIDTIAFTNLLPGETRIVNAAWVPTRAGHTCLQDVIDSPQDPYNRGLECSPQWVPWDNNVEWHNVNIIENPGGSLRGAMDVQQSEVQLVNVYNLAQDVDLVIERRSFPGSGTITVQLPADLFDRWQASANGWGVGIQVLPATKEIRVTGAVSATIGAIPMDAAEQATVGLVFEGPAGLEFEIALREVIGDLTVGGTSYQWLIPDTTPPQVTGKTPVDGAIDVAPDAPLVITFDEEIAPLNLQLTLTPDPGGWRFTWNEAGTVVTATHTTFAGETTYAATVTASDGWGNDMAAPVSWSFTTTRYQVYLPLVLKNH